MSLLATLLTLHAVFGAHALEGNARSAVRVVIFEDLQCSECAAFRSLLDSHLLTKFGHQVAFEHRDFPSADHPWSGRAAAAARFFDSQNPRLGVQFRRQVFAEMKSITPEDLATWVAAFARQYAVDPVRAVASMNSAALKAEVENDVRDGQGRGVQKAPAIFVNGEPFSEALTLESISQAIHTAMNNSKKPE